MCVLPVFLHPWVTPASVLSTSFVVLFLVQIFLYVRLNVQPCSLTDSYFSLPCSYTHPKDLLNHIILFCHSSSNLSYSCCTSLLPKSPAKKILLSFDLLYSSSHLSTGQWEYGMGQHFYTSIKMFLVWKSPSWDVQVIYGSRGVKNNSFEGGDTGHRHTLGEGGALWQSAVFI